MKMNLFFKFLLMYIGIIGTFAQTTTPDSSKYNALLYLMYSDCSAVSYLGNPNFRCSFSQIHVKKL